MKNGKLFCCLAFLAILAAPVYADSVLPESPSGKAYANFNLRYEGVDQDNALKDASALTLRTRFGYETGNYSGLSAVIEFEDSRSVLGVNNYSTSPTGFNPGVYSEIADPKSTELDQGYLAYQSRYQQFEGKLGRQLMIFDGMRFIGHVGWRQDRQTYDALRLTYKPVKNLVLNYAFIGQRNRIFAEVLDVDSKDHLLNGTYELPIGKLGAYAYLLEVDNNINNGLDTFGAFLNGSRNLQGRNVSYSVELATQETTSGNTNFDASYAALELGVEFAPVTLKVGVEKLGSDKGNYGFSTPLATLHKFNGWADQFGATPAAGLVDTYVSASGEYAGNNWTLVLHDFAADKSSATVDDFGDEINLQVTRKFAKKHNVGVALAIYNAGDVATNKVDTNKLWLWYSTGF